MSAATASFTETVHVRLLDEGVDVWRPVKARAVGAGSFQLASEPAPPDEHWEFGPGATVRVEPRSDAQGKPVLVAVKPAKRERRR